MSSDADTLTGLASEARLAHISADLGHQKPGAAPIAFNVTSPGQYLLGCGGEVDRDPDTILVSDLLIRTAGSRERLIARSLMAGRGYQSVQLESLLWLPAGSYTLSSVWRCSAAVQHSRHETIRQRLVGDEFTPFSLVCTNPFHDVYTTVTAKTGRNVYVTAAAEVQGPEPRISQMDLGTTASPLRKLTSVVTTGPLGMAVSNVPKIAVAIPAYDDPSPLFIGINVAAGAGSDHKAARLSVMSD